ncbi:CAAX protease self-immunity [Halorubrum vacuolatum]|uniref:CAAX protease self-immunity n=2 Tax=Halorubrum vacuolatum TaxID=63740 RepID=A0A238WCB0_HALVU|nr:CAAX protease self-immunity [Halorubrum vacuolatum]
MSPHSTSQSTENIRSIAFEKGLGPPILFLFISSLWVVFVPLAIYPLFDNRFVLLAVMAGAFAVTAAIAWLVLRWEGLSAADVGLSREHVLPGIGLVLLFWVIINVVGALSAFVSTGDVRFGIPEQWDSFAFFLGIGIAQLVFVGLAEEFAFRAYLQNKLIALLNGGRDRVRKGAAILLGVLLFTVWHVPQRVFIGGFTSPTAIVQSLIVVMVLGLALGLLYEYTRNVVFVAVLHGTFNWQPQAIVGAPTDLPFFAGLAVLLVVVWYYRRWAGETRPADFQPQIQATTARWTR